MLKIASTHGQAYHENGSWKIQCKFENGESGVVSAVRRSVFRRRLLDRGLTIEQIAEILQVQPK